MKFLTSVKIKKYENNFTIDNYIYSLEEFEKTEEEKTEEEKTEEEKTEEFNNFLKNFLDYYYLKSNVKKRKNLNKIRKGTAVNEKKNSVYRDKNNTLTQQFINLISRKGDKIKLFNQFNLMVENFFLIFNINEEEFLNYENYTTFSFIMNKNRMYNNFNFLLLETLPRFNSLFDIKTKRTPKKLKLNTKYMHTVVYTPKLKRIKSTLRALSTQTEKFKNYYLWERFFWLFLALILKPNKSFLIKRREFIYIKSLKFFLKK